MVSFRWMKVFWILLLVVSVLGNQIFNVLEFGAKGNGKTKDTIPIQKTINYASNSCRFANTVCTVLFPPNHIFLTGALNLTSNVIYHISKNTTLLGSTDEGDYPVIDVLPSYGDGRDISGIVGFATLLT